MKEYKIGYFDQNLATLNTSTTVIESIHSLYPMKTLLEVRSLLARFLFTEEDVFKPVEVLSGGECVRLALCLLMLEEPEFLVLDEPTNHLDIDTKNVVEDVFEEWEGPMLFISHDRYFINKVANKIMHFEANGITVFEGDYDQYKTDREKRQALEKPEKSITKRSEKAAPNAQKTERMIDHLHQEIEKLRLSLFDATVYSDPNKYKEVEASIAAKEAEIETLFETIANSETI